VTSEDDIETVSLGNAATSPHLSQANNTSALSEVNVDEVDAPEVGVSEMLQLV